VEQVKGDNSALDYEIIETATSLTVWSALVLDEASITGRQGVEILDLKTVRQGVSWEKRQAYPCSNSF